MRLGDAASSQVTVGFLCVLTWPALTAAQSPQLNDLLAQAGKAARERRVVEAEKLYLTALEEAKKLGPDNPKLSLAANALGSFYMGNNQHAKAEPLLEQALGIDQKTRGPNDRRVAADLNNLATLYEMDGREADAEKLLKQALLIEENAAIPGRWSQPIALTNLAWLYQREHRYPEAEQLMERALTACENEPKAWGVECARLRQQLAGIYRAEGREADADRLLSDALLTTQRPGNPDWEEAEKLKALADHYKAQGASDRAEDYYNRAIAVLEKSKRPEAALLPGYLEVLGELLREEHRYAEAEVLFLRAVENRENAQGRQRQNSVSSILLVHLLNLYREEGRLAAFEPVAQRALAVQEQVLGPDHEELTGNLLELAQAYREEGKYADAEPLYLRVLEIHEKNLGPNHVQVAGALQQYADLLRLMGHEADAASANERAQAIFDQLRKQNPKR